ncbi:NADPH:quinone reductase [Rhodococcus tibetensis]|uniref:NADPH:quinone reductase n=1 Tax=Rhodococcus tibetensis TaxID=2965064 RepID=A0ABT1QJE4_9NOCA|nr:NADPH:quinone reductase [Rhodococcus sp. FXJ9.536]MCQ4122332.1 NADPH:quinone reductase [Rhodococcus sp. FXJ9.536]
MRAAWYDRKGRAREVLEVGDLPDPEPGPGEVRIRTSASGINPGDVGKRWGLPGAPMPFPRVIPHSDGSGVIDAVGSGVDGQRVGQNVWCYGAQSYRPFGTAAEYCVVPDALAVRLPDDADTILLDQAACLGIAGITGYRALFADGPLDGLTALIYGAAGGVGSIATQMAVRDGARVIGVVRTPAQQDFVRGLGAHEVFLTSDPHLLADVRKAAPDGVNRIAEVDFAGHIEFNSKIVAVGATISSYYSSDARPHIPYWPLGFADTNLRLLGSDDFAPAVKAHAAAELTAALLDGGLRISISERLPLDRIATAHEHIERGGGGRVLLGL